MALAKRIIPCLDVDNGRVVKGVKFENIRDAGDPVEIARRYDEQGADEITFLDITASVDGRDTTLHTVERMASQVFIPLTVGVACGPCRTSATCSTPVPTRSRSTPPRCSTQSLLARRRTVSVRSASLSPSMPRKCPGQVKRRAGRFSLTAGANRRGWMQSSGRRRWKAWALARSC